METNDNENTMNQNPAESVKVVLRRKYIAIQAHLKKQEKHQINNLNIHLKLMEKEQKHPKLVERKKIIKIRSETSEKGMMETIANINKTKSLFFKKINKINKLLARLLNKNREKTQINKIRNKNGEIITDNTEIQKIIRDYFEELYVNKMDNLEEMDTFLEKYNLSKLNQKEI